MAAVELDPNESVVEDLYLTVAAELAKFEKQQEVLRETKIKGIDITVEERPKFSNPRKHSLSDKKNKDFIKIENGNIKQEITSASKITDEARFENLSTASNTSNGQGADEVDQKSDFWKLLYNYTDQESPHSLELLFEVNSQTKIPKEFEEVGK